MNDSNYRVLVFDDDPNLGEMMREFLLITCKCAVEVVGSENDFWPRIKEKDYDILFLDYQLQGTTGLEILGKLKQVDHAPPTVMMTGQGSETIAAQAIQEGAIDYLVKGEYAMEALPGLVEKAVQQRRLQQAMRRSSEKIRYQAVLLNNMRDALVVWDLGGTITYWNEAAESLYGLNAADMIGEPAAEVYFPLFTTPVRLGGETVAEKILAERKNVGSDQRVTWISSLISPLFDREGQTIGYMDVTRDISNQKQIEQKLQMRLQGEQLLASISSQFIMTPSSLSDTEFHQAIEAVAQYIGAQMGALFVYSDGVLYNRVFYDNGAYANTAFVFRRDSIDLQAEENRWLAEIMAGQEMVLVSGDKIPNLQDSQGESYVEGTRILIPMVAQNGAVGLLIFCLPLHRMKWDDDFGYIMITFSKIVLRALLHIRSDQDLRASEERYRAIVEDYQTEMICHFQGAAALTFVNEAYCNYYGEDRWSLLGTSFYDPIVTEDCEGVQTLVAALNVDYPQEHSIHRVISGSGEVRWQEWSIRGIDDEQGGFIEYQAVGRDITDRKLMEAEVQSAQSRLAEAARLASIGRLAASVAHQISNPLTTVIGEGQILKNILESEHAGFESAEAIVKAGWRAQLVIDVLMKFSDSSDDEQEWVSIQETFNEALALSNVQHHSDGVKVDVQLGDEPLLVYGSRRQFVDLWVNFLLAIPSLIACKESKRLHIHGEIDDEGQILVTIQVEGLLKSDEIDSSVLEPQMIPTGGGPETGIELSVCREIVRRHAGNIVVKSGEADTMFVISFKKGTRA